MRHKIRDQNGQSLVELLIAMAIFVLVVSSIMFLTLDSQQANRQGSERTKAVWLAEEGLEAAKSIANSGWRFLNNGDHGVTSASGSWDWQGIADVVDKFTRKVTIEPVYRDVNGDIVDTGGTLDFDTKKATARTDWNFTTARPSEVVLEAYLTNWRSVKWLQTTQAEFDQGTLINAVTTATGDGEVELDQTTVTTFYDWTFDNPGDYVYNPVDIEVASSRASLRNQSLPIFGSTRNPGFETGLAPWVYADWDQDPGEINVKGSRRGGGGNPGASFRIRFPRRSRFDQVGGFIEQAFQVTESNPDVGTVKLDWRVSRYSGNPPLSLEVFVFLDTASGEPVPGTEIWSSGPLSGTTGYATEAVDITSLIPTQGTYYLKLAAWLVSGSERTGVIDIRFDNASAFWEKYTGYVYPSNNPPIQPVSSFASPEVLNWKGFQETAIKNGGEIYYQLSDDNGATWQYWNGSAWATATGATDYNTASVINTNIASFPAAAQQIMFKAFLSSDGTQLVSLDTVRITYDAIKFLDSTFDVPSEYTFDSAKIEIQSSEARLVNQGVLIGSGGTTNSTFDNQLSPWVFNTWGVDSGEITPRGRQRDTGGNPAARARLRFRNSTDDEVGGYFEQSFQVTENNPTLGTVEMDWQLRRYPANDPLSLEVFIYLDDFSGEPVPGTHIWSSGNIRGTTAWSLETVDITSLIPTQGTYYLKLAAWLVSGGNEVDRIEFSFDNSLAYWEKWTADYPTDNPSIQPNASLQASDVSSWYSFQETAIKNGGEIYYQLSDDNGATWQYWNGSAWATATGATDYNTASVINTNIASFPAAAQQIMFKAFLSSDGTQFVRLDNVRIEYFVSGEVGYYLLGSLESSTYDTGSTVPIFNYIDWTDVEPAGTWVDWQLRTADTEAGLSAATWVGPDGTSASFYSTPGEVITTDPGASGTQWMQYKAYLYSNGTNTPIINDVTIDYAQ